MATHITVLKFGGTSIEDGAAFARVAKIIKTRTTAPLVVIVWALSGVTTRLLKVSMALLIRGVENSLALKRFTYALQLPR